MRKCTLCHCGPSTTGAECHSAQEVYVASGCLTHSHPVDMKKVRVSDVTKSYIVNLLQSGKT